MDKSQPGRVAILDETIDELSSASLEKIFSGVTGKALTVDCGQLKRINSEGVRLLNRALKVLADKGVKLVFQRCTPSLIEHVNTYDGFLCGGTIESVMSPYMCRKCGKGSFVLLTPDAIRKEGLRPKPVACGVCGGSSTFDDNAEFFFGFLKR